MAGNRIPINEINEFLECRNKGGGYRGARLGCGCGIDRQKQFMVNFIKE